MTEISGQLVDIPGRVIRPVTILIENGVISQIQDNPQAPLQYLMPGFVDAHVHVESSMLSPAQFARLAVPHGTVGTVSDPHEIANVLGVPGVEWMIDSARKVPFHFCFGAPSCVPATPFETAGAVVTPSDVEYLLSQYPEVGYLAEVMNFPGVINGDPDMRAKISIAQELGYPVDGHAPGLRGEAARQYIAAGCQTDHECFTAEEALDKLQYGMKILIREGSAAKNFDALIPLLPEHYANLMFCSDDKHPDGLVLGHINLLVKRALALYPDRLFEILLMACLNPVEHYRLPVGQLREGDSADFIVVDSLTDFNILQTFIKGECVAESGQSRIPSYLSEPINHFQATEKSPADFQIPFPGSEAQVRVIEVLDGQLITNALTETVAVTNDLVGTDTERDVLKIAVINRYADVPPAVAFIRNFGLKKGALASCVAHDSHNIVAVGVDDESIAQAVNLIIQEKGGIAAVDELEALVLPLPVAGILSGEDGYWVAEQYATLDAFAKQQLGCTLASPFMSLSFMALLVIPSLKLSDKGLFNGDTFQFTNVFN
ncbi:adenine deaminase [Siphonobacter sp. BAB-5405]|uniref:adenine deaminase n=1 Tax=Siphonobacter sp. BAB-5405 TaxID=1864825 RepID=UPI000C7FD1F1|nr:adenine deaminase [Siphonobacter sp. BAB-5405]PMD94508.1 adenine deaminase [Siphonobacter sp. BAB-5405]